MNLLITLAIIFRLLHKCICNIPERSQRTANSYARAAVAADHTRCSQVGVEVLKKNGSAVDSYIATCLCSGIMNPMSSGIGGGGFAVVYDRQQKKHYVYDYRETAPLAMNEEFFKGRYNESEYGRYNSNQRLTQIFIKIRRRVFPKYALTLHSTFDPLAPPPHCL